MGRHRQKLMAPTVEFLSHGHIASEHDHLLIAHQLGLELDHLHLRMHELEGGPTVAIALGDCLHEQAQEGATTRLVLRQTILHAIVQLVEGLGRVFGHAQQLAHQGIDVGELAIGRQHQATLVAQFHELRPVGLRRLLVNDEALARLGTGHD